MQLYTVLERLPDPQIPIEDLDEESKAWIDNYKIVDALGLDGQSSDESDDDNDGVYNVKILDWRNKNLVKRLNKADAARKTTNKYGTRRPGTKSRTHKMRLARDSRVTGRVARTEKPINFYNEDWYMALTAQQKIDLKAGPMVEFPTSLSDDD